MQQTSLPKPPKPETGRALLISAGISKQTFTTHHYLETRPTTVRVLKADGDFRQEPAWEYIFKCFQTGAERRWGLVPRSGYAGGGTEFVQEEVESDPIDIIVSSEPDPLAEYREVMPAIALLPASSLGASSSFGAN